MTRKIVLGDIEAAYRMLLGRDPDKSGLDSYRLHAKKGMTVAELRGEFLSSPEFRHLNTGLNETSSFRVPGDLSSKSHAPCRALLVGQCLFDPWPEIISRFHPKAKIERVDYNNAAKLPDAPQRPFSDYDMQIVSIPLRSIIREADYFQMDMSTPTAASSLLELAKKRLELQIHEILIWYRLHGITTLFCNFLIPQQNPLGRTIPRNDPRNLCYLINKLNDYVSEVTASMRGVYILDVDSISSSVGKRYIQDDAICAFSHGGLIENYLVDRDQRRIVPPKLDIEQAFFAKREQYIAEVWLEACAIMRTVRHVDPIKLVIMDLDDVMWRGVLAEGEDIGAEAIEGWPLGVWDALSFLQKRGIILAIASKNDEGNIATIFDREMNTRLPLNSFAIRKINWNPKIDNVLDIIREANVGAHATLFVDDNPVERLAIQSALPEVRTIGADPYALKRVLLWSAETQVETISQESSERNATIANVVLRNGNQTKMSREEFLAGLNTHITFLNGLDLNQERLERALELLNKTNQFNTTGQRWNRSMFKKAMDDKNTRLVCFEVSDVAVNYGLVGVVILDKSEIKQAVLSCRVFGMDIEHAVLNAIVSRLFRLGETEITARLNFTDRNTPCRSWFSDNGFSFAAGQWRLSKANWRARSSFNIQIRGKPLG